ncbi:MAG: hypothetical protein KC912_03775 [Proteobacteria bacterium]|nr:hypothetical protein [Pseudomonadota bacterium]
MPVVRTALAEAALGVLTAEGLAGPGARAGLERLVAAVPTSLGVLFELVLGAEHPAEVDLAIRLAPEDMHAALKALGSTAVSDWSELMLLEPYRAWIELDCARPLGPVSVFAQLEPGVHPSTLRRVLARLGVDGVPQGSVRHLGVLHGRTEREVRVVVQGGDVFELAADLGLDSPEPGAVAEVGELNLAFGYGPQLLERFGIEASARRGGQWTDVPMTAVQRGVIDQWDTHVGPRARGQVSHFKWVGPEGQRKVYLAVL